MIDPFNITDYNRSQAELERFLLFVICVAGKNAQRTATAIEKVLAYEFSNRKLTPFQQLALYRRHRMLRKALESAGIGQYTRIIAAIHAVLDANLDLSTCTLEQLEAIPGIGPKSARFFLLHSRPNQQVAVIDTHMLKWLAALGYAVPKSGFPNRKQYAILEQAFLTEAKAAGRDLAEFDLAIWSSYAKKKAA